MSSDAGQATEHPPVAEEVRLELIEPTDPLLDDLAHSHQEYVRLYKAALVAQRENALGAVEAVGAVQRAPINDKEGRPIFLFYPSRLAAGEAEGVSLEQVMSHALLLMHSTVVTRDSAYTVVWVTNNLDPDRLGYFWFRSTYKMVPRAYHKNMRSLCIVHPSISTRLTLLMLSYMLSTTFWEKLVYADRIEFLDEVLDYKTVGLPSDVIMYDKFLDKEMETQAAQMQAGMGSTWGGTNSLNSFGGGFGAGLTGEALGSTHESRFEEWKHGQQPGSSSAGAAGSTGPAAMPYNRELNRDDEEEESEDDDDEVPRIVDVTHEAETNQDPAGR